MDCSIFVGHRDFVLLCLIFLIVVDGFNTYSFIFICVSFISVVRHAHLRPFPIDSLNFLLAPTGASGFSQTDFRLDRFALHR